MKSGLKILQISISVLMILFLQLISPFVLAHISFQVQSYRLRDEVYEYVLEYKDIIELNNSEFRQYFVYHEWGFVDAGIIYGYYYSPEDWQLNVNKPYRNGYLKYGTPYFGSDWCYFEKICDNWYYYEEHYG